MRVIAVLLLTGKSYNQTETKTCCLPLLESGNESRQCMITVSWILMRRGGRSGVEWSGVEKRGEEWSGKTSLFDFIVSCFCLSCMSTEAERLYWDNNKSARIRCGYLTLTFAQSDLSLRKDHSVISNCTILPAQRFNKHLLVAHDVATLLTFTDKLLPCWKKSVSSCDPARRVTPLFLTEEVHQNGARFRRSSTLQKITRNIMKWTT